MRDFQSPQMTLHRRPAYAQGAGCLGCIQLAAALPHDVFKKQRKLFRIAETKKFLDISGKKRIDPFTVKAYLFGCRQQRLGKTAVIEPLHQGSVFERRQFISEHGGQMDKALSSRQRITEFTVRRES